MAAGSINDGLWVRGTPVTLTNAGDYGEESGNPIEVLHRFIPDERDEITFAKHELSVGLDSPTRMDKVRLTLDADAGFQRAVVSLIVGNTIVSSGEFVRGEPIAMQFPSQQVDAFRITIENVTGETNPVESMRFLQTPQAAGRRFMLIGNSITLGVGDGDRDRVGFRRKLHDKLTIPH